MADDDAAILAKYETVAPGAPKPPHAKPAAAKNSSTKNTSPSDTSILAKYGASTAPGTEHGSGGTLNIDLDPQRLLNDAGNLLTRVGVPQFLEKLDRPRQAVQSAAGPNHSFDLSGVSPADQDVNRAATRKNLGLEPAYNVMPHAAQGLIDFGVDTASDPTIIGGKVMDALRALGITRKVAAVAKPAIAAAAAPVGRAVAAKTPQIVKDNLTAVSDFIRPGGAAARHLGPDATGAAFAADNRQAALAEEAKRVLTERFDKEVGSLPDADRTEVYRALNGERDTRGMTPAQLKAYTTARGLTTQAGGMQADASGRLKLAYGGGHLMAPGQVAKVTRNGAEIPRAPAAPAPDHSDMRTLAEQLFGKGTDADLLAPKPPSAPRTLTGRVNRDLDLGDMADFAAPVDQGIMGSANVRSRYLPAPHTAAAETGRPARTFNLLQPSAPNMRERTAFEVNPDSLPGFDSAFRSMLGKAAEQGTAGRMRDELGVKLGSPANNPHLLDLFERTAQATGDERGLGQRNAELWRNIVNIPKNTVSTIGLKHGLVNVPALAHQSEGAGAAAEGLSGGAAALRQTPAEHFAANREGILGGVIAPFGDRANPIADTLAKIPGPLGHLLGGASEKANTLTWAIDDASKQAVYTRKLARNIADGMGEVEARNKAAKDTLHEMVDYRHISAATKLLKNVAPFATFRSKIPGAVASSVARNPQRLLTADRATQGLYGSGEVQTPGVNDQGKPNRFHMTNPISDVLGLGEPSGIARYGRSMIADPLKALLSLPGDYGEARGSLSPRQAELLRYLTYGQHVFPHMKDGKLKAGFIGQQMAGYAPLGVGEDALAVAGGSDFPTPDPLSMLLGGTVGGYLR